MILEGIVTSLTPAGSLNIAPMGPTFGDGIDTGRFSIRPFRSSHTYDNLRAHGEGVFHVTDDVLLIARATLGAVDDCPTGPAKVVRGRVIETCCRFYEFRVTKIDELPERPEFLVETVHQASLREFFGFNRAKHSVLELAILASRVRFRPVVGLETELEKHRLIVEKTGGPNEAEACLLLYDYILQYKKNND